LSCPDDAIALGSGPAYAILGLACLAADRGDWPRATTLHGAAQALTDQIAEPWQALEARYRRDSLDKIRTSFGEEQFTRAYAKGMTLSLEQALGLALGTAAPPDTDDSGRGITAHG
jgi:hypothetical protein